MGTNDHQGSQKHLRSVGSDIHQLRSESFGEIGPVVFGVPGYDVTDISKLLSSVVKCCQHITINMS